MKLGIVAILGLFLIILISGCTSQTESVNSPQNQCDNFTLSIQSTSNGPGMGWAGVTFCVLSTKNGNAEYTVKLKNGGEIKQNTTLQAGSCMLEQVSQAIVNGQWINVAPSDVSYIQVISKECPQVQDLVVNMSKIGYQTTENNPYCGDGICQSSESCSTCPSDCENCAPQYSASIKFDDGWSSLAGITQIQRINSNEFVYTGTNNYVPGDALFVIDVNNRGNVDISDVTATTTCWLESGSNGWQTLQKKYDYFECGMGESMCSYVETQTIYSQYTVGKTVSIPSGKASRFNLRFSWAENNTAPLNLPIIVNCKASAYSQSNPSISDTSNIKIHFE